MAVRVFVNGHVSWLNGLRKALEFQLEALRLPQNSVPVYDHDPRELPSRSIVLYFSDAPHALLGDDESSLRAHIEQADNDPNRIVIPVLDSIRDATGKLPELLHRFNAFEFGDPPDYDSLVHEILDRVWHARLTRHVFISYRRSDSVGVARQLRDELAARRYEVFLDESSIRPGADFQRELMAWLNDSDFVLLVASPHLDNSKWVQEEIAFANTSYVGILALCWPRGLGGPSSVTDSLFEDQKHPLQDGDILIGPDPETHKLSPSAIDDIIAKIDRFRAGAIFQRLKNLVPLVTKDPAIDGVGGWGRFGDISFRHVPSGRRICLRVLPFRPSICTIHELSQAPGTRGFERAGCFYMENDVTLPLVQALRWVLGRYNADRGEPDYRVFPYTGEFIDWTA